MNKLADVLVFGAVVFLSLPSAFAQGVGAGNLEDKPPCASEIEAAFRQADDVVVASPVTQPTGCEINALGWLGCWLEVEINEVFKGREDPDGHIVLSKDFRWDHPDPLPRVDLSESWVLFLDRWSSNAGGLLQCTDCLRLMDSRASFPVLTEPLQACLTALREE